LNKIIDDLRNYFEILKFLHASSGNNFSAEFGNDVIADKISSWFNIKYDRIIKKHIEILVMRKFLIPAREGYKINICLFELEQEFIKKYKFELQLGGFVE